MRDMWKTLREAGIQGEERYVLTCMAEEHLGDSLIFLLDGTLVCGTPNAGAAEYIRSHEYQGPEIIEGTDGIRWFWQKLEREKEILILGAGHISRCLEQQYRYIGYHCTILDDRAEFADPNLFPSAAEVICGDYDAVLSQLPLSRFSGAVVVTRGHTWDRLCLHHLLPAKIPYIGMLGSRRRVEVVKKLLREEGVDPAWMEQLYAPVGLDIGSETPEEIALAIAAETLAVLRRRRGGHLCKKG